MRDHSYSCLAVRYPVKIIVKHERGSWIRGIRAIRLRAGFVEFIYSLISMLNLNDYNVSWTFSGRRDSAEEEILEDSTRFCSPYLNGID